MKKYITAARISLAILLVLVQLISCSSNPDKNSNTYSGSSSTISSDTSLGSSDSNGASTDSDGSSVTGSSQADSITGSQSPTGTETSGAYSSGAISNTVSGKSSAGSSATSSGAPIVAGPDQQWIAKEYTFTSAKNYGGTAQNVGTTDFEDGTIPGGWSSFSSGSISISSAEAHGGTRSLCQINRTNRWDSPAYNIYNVVKANGEGIYEIKFWVYVDILPKTQSVSVLIRGNKVDANSFIINNGGNYFGSLMSNISLPAKSWVQCTSFVKILASDITRASGTFNVMLDFLDTASGQKVYIDDFEIGKESATDVFSSVKLDAVFKGPNNAMMTVPAFWDGGNTWKVRFAPTATGKWTYKTVCSDTSNRGLNGKTGSFTCTPYAGNLDIYKHGFVKTQPNVRYFMHADGTPFFYLGDTHWSMPSEPIDSSVKAGIASQFKYIVDKRVAQGFTVYQSEPIGAQYNFNNGVTTADIPGLKDMDARFKYIADKGLVHANSQFFFVTAISNNASKLDSNGENEYLDNLCRMWVARYGAYPVMWTTAQECDFPMAISGSDGNTPYLAAWKYVAKQINKYDYNKHPASAHQEAVVYGTNATNSAFRNVPGHSWYAVQWSPPSNSQIDFKPLEDFWNNGQGKPIVNYEGSYDHLWTLEFGARQQGWTAYLNGMFGQGYGAEDIWLYNSTYDMENDSVRGDVIITVKDKQIKWYDSINLPSATQLGTHMHKFFDTFEWWKLKPCFNDPDMKYIYFPTWGYSAATISNQTYVAYFYNKTIATGMLLGLATGKTYTGKWFNPRTGIYTKISSGIKGVGPKSSFSIPVKPDSGDWVLYVTINN
ncbi:MAG: apiosidase-like domain-containing protein [Saccharofermentanales bacterium]